MKYFVYNEVLSIKMYFFIYSPVARLTKLKIRVFKVYIISIKKKIFRDLTHPPPQMSTAKTL